MSTHRTPRSPIAAARRKAVAERRLGKHRTCTTCGESRATALIAKSQLRICEACQRKKSGKSPIDQHHPAGRANHPLTVPVPANDHRAVLTDAQHDWPAQTLNNPDGDPLLRVAACLRGAFDTVVYILENLLLWSAEHVERIAAYLTQTLGRGWWRNMPEGQ